MLTRLADLTWEEVAERAGRSLLVVPLGATEQHGPHLPVSTDTIVAAALADRLGEAHGDVVVAPAVPYGASGEHAGFSGTLSIGHTALELLVVELVRSADAFAATLLLSGHGGNAEPLARAVATLRAEGRRVHAWSPGAVAANATDGKGISDGGGCGGVGGADAHAGRTETSLLLALDPSSVRSERAAAGDTRPLAEILPALRAGGVQALSANGVLGDPAGATAGEGAALLDAWVADLLASLAGWP